MPYPHNAPRGDEIPIGTRVEVRSSYLGSWSRGFEVAEPTAQGYWVRRDSDRYLLPRAFGADDVRRDT